MTLFRDIRQVLIDNSVKEIQEQEDKVYLEAVERALGLSIYRPDYVAYERDGLVHMTGLVYGVRKTFCGLTPYHGGTYSVEPVTCLECLAGPP